MNDSPGWASPGSDPSGTSGSDVPDGAALPEQAGPPEEEAPRSGTSDTPGANGAGPAAPPVQDSVPPNWSANQPPAGGWGSPPQAPRSARQPGNPVPPPPPGPGLGSAPYQGGWGTMPGQTPYWAPPPPRPGVIPLRPLGVNDIFEGAISTIRVHWRTVLGISVIVALVTEITATLVTGLFFNHNENLTKIEQGRTLHARDLAHFFASAMAGAGVTVIISVLGQLIATAMLIMIVSRSVIGRPVTASEVWRDARPQLPRMLGLLLTLFLIGAGTIGVGVLPGTLVAVFGSTTAGAGLLILGFLVAAGFLLWLSVSFCLTSPILMLEKQGVRATIARSFALVRGSWWRVCGVQLLAVLLFAIVTGLAEAPFSAIATITDSGMSATSLTSHPDKLSWAALVITGIGSFIGSTFTLPMNANITSLLYIDQRIRKEGLDIELARAAGVPGYEAK